MMQGELAEWNKVRRKSGYTMVKKKKDCCKSLKFFEGGQHLKNSWIINVHKNTSNNADTDLCVVSIKLGHCKKYFSTSRCICMNAHLAITGLKSASHVL